MKKAKKIVALLLCAVLLIGASVAGTAAYLTSKATVTNTFTVGKVNIKLDEAKLNKETGAATGEGRTETGNEDVKLIPGRTIDKDPTVTVIQNSEACYVRMKVQVENLADLKAALDGAEYYANGIFLLQNLCVDKDGNNSWNNGDWIYKSFDEATSTYEFWYKEAVARKTDGDTVLSALFTAITVPGKDITSDNIEKLASVKIIVTAEAIQAEGFATAEDAWAAFGA